jgi:phage-related protein
MAFNDFPRGLPYNLSVLTNVEIIEFDDGTEQRRDLWGGKTKKQITIMFNVNSKTEIMAIHDFFVSQCGPSQSFEFEDPITEETLNVRFVENSFNVERRHYGTYFGSAKLIEVF